MIQSQTLLQPHFIRDHPKIMNPKKIETCIYTLIMDGDFESSKLALGTLLHQLNENRQLFLLINGSHSETISTYYKKYSYVHIFSSEKNLGVAGGRNFLIKKAREFSPDYLVSMDNDIILPDNYFSEIVGKLKTDDPQLGILAPACINAVQCIEPLLKATKEGHSKDSHQNDIYKVSPDSILKIVKSSRSKTSPKLYYHLGVRHWVIHYLTSLNPLYRPIRLLSRILAHLKIPFPSPRPTYLASDRREIVKMLNRRQLRSCDTVAGGLHAYRASLLDKVGQFDERFNPFGYEDADFCIRAKKAGFQNYVCDDIIVAHDIDKRLHTREDSYILYLRGKAKKILISKHLPSIGWKTFACYLDALVLHPVLQILLRRGKIFRVVNNLKCVYYYYLGFLKY